MNQKSEWRQIFLDEFYEDVFVLARYYDARDKEYADLARRILETKDLDDSKKYIPDKNQWNKIRYGNGQKYVETVLSEWKMNPRYPQGTWVYIRNTNIVRKWVEQNYYLSTGTIPYIKHKYKAYHFSTYKISDEKMVKVLQRTMRGSDRTPCLVVQNDRVPPINSVTGGKTALIWPIGHNGAFLMEERWLKKARDLYKKFSKS